jgi:hypothetical protein
MIGMLSRISIPRLVVPLWILAAGVFAGSDYVGYSGAPGTLGTCAASCHGTTDGTITVSGFPAQYTPGQAYTITLGHDSGPTLWNFNASVRVGLGAQTAGLLTAGLYTETYFVETESNGVHMPTYDHDSCTFVWTAPDPGVGDVRLYVAGHQDHTNGPNTTLVLVSGQLSGVSNPRPVAWVRADFEVQPSIVSDRLVISIRGPQSARVRVRITDGSGRVINRLTLPSCTSGELTFTWQPLDRSDRRLAAGVYYACTDVAGNRLLRRFVIPAR